MASRFTVWTDFKVGKNETGTAINMSRMGMKSLSKTASRTASVMKGVFGGMLAFSGLSKLQEGIADVKQQFIEFDHTVTAAGARFGPAFYRGTEGAAQMRDAVREVGATTEFTAAQVAVGLGEYAKAGIDASTAMGMLKYTAELATNAETDFAEAASISLDALDAFNLRSKDASKTAENLAGVNDILTKVVTSAKLEFTDFSETLSYAGPVAAQTGASLKSMAVLTGLVAKAGIRGSMAGTTLKNTYLGLAAPVGKGKTALKKLGIQITDNEGNMRDTLDILIDFKKATEEMGNAQRLATIDAVFGKRAIAGVSKILSIGTDDLIEYRTNIDKTSGAASEMANEMRNSVQNRIEKLHSAFVELGFKFFDAFGPHMEKGIAGVSKWLDEANKPGSEVAKTLADIANGLATTIKFIVDNRETIISLAKAYIFLKGSMMIGGAISGAIGMITNLSSAFGGMTGNIAGPGGTISAIGIMKVSLRSIPSVLGPVTAALGTGLALGNMLWESIERNRKAAEKLANVSLNQEQRLTPGKLSGYSDESLNKLEQINRGEATRSFPTLFGWDPNREEHDTAKRAAQNMLSRIQAEKARRAEQMGRIQNDSSYAWSNGNQSITRTNTERTETVQRQQLEITKVPDGFNAKLNPAGAMP